MKGRICLLIFSCLITEPLSLFAIGYFGIGEGGWEVYIWFKVLKEKPPSLKFKLRFIQEILKSILKKTLAISEFLRTRLNPQRFGS